MAIDDNASYELTGTQIKDLAAKINAKANTTDLPSVMTGATAQGAGTSGLVPAPTTSDVDKYLKGDGTWGNVSAYTLPPATTTTLGGVIVGNNLTVDSAGVLSATGTTYTLPIASAATLGGIKVGNNLSIDTDGVLSTHAPYTLPTASASTLGGIKVGSNLSIDSNGVLSATASPTLYSTTGQNTDGAMTQKAATDMVFAPGHDPATSPNTSIICIGNKTQPSYGAASIAIGAMHWTEGAESIVVGNSSQSFSDYCLAIGGGQATAGTYGGGNVGTRAVAVGYHSTANGTGSVALGAESKTGSVNYVVSVGSGESSDSATYQYRRIVNVADAINAHDAVTKGQLDTAAASILAGSVISLDQGPSSSAASGTVIKSSLTQAEFDKIAAATTSGAPALFRFDDNSGDAWFYRVSAITPVDSATVVVDVLYDGGLSWQHEGLDKLTFTAYAPGATYPNGAITLTATSRVPAVNLYTTTGQNTDGAVTQKLFTDTVGNVETILQTLNTGTGV